MISVITLVLGVTIIVFCKRLGRFETRMDSAMLGESGGRLWDNWNTFLWVIGGSVLIFGGARGILD